MDLFNKYKFHSWRIWNVLVMIIFIIFIINIFYSYILTNVSMDHPNLEESDWYYKIGGSYDGEFDKVHGSIVDRVNTGSKLKESIYKAPKDSIYYKTILPNTKITDPHLLIQTNDQVFEVYVNEKLIYSFGNFEKFDYKHSPGAPIHLIPLPEEYQTKELLIVMKSVSKKRLGLIRAIELDSKGNHFIRIFKMNIIAFILGWISIVIGIACMLIGTVKRLGRKALFSLGFSFIVVGIWSISENALTQLFNFRPVFWFYVAMISFSLIPVSIYKFIKDISNANEKVLSLLIHLHLILFGVFLILNMAGIAAFINVMTLYYIITGFSFVVCVITSAKSYYKGNGKLLICTVGLIVFGVFGLYDILGWYFRVIYWKVNMAPWGMFIFQLALIYALIMYLKDIQDKLTQYNIKLNEKEKQINQAKEYDKIKTEFFANVSHEMRTPLNIIYTTNQLMKVYNDKGLIKVKETNVEKYINIINQNCYRLMKLINNIIDIAKIESDFYKLKFKKIDIVSLVENITMSIEEYAKKKEIKLIFDTEPEEKTIVCDPDGIERIMLNLLSNAIKFSKKGDLIYVSVKMGEGYIYIVVEDTGIGIPKDKIDSVFDRFVQVDKSFTRQNEGSGIGLAIVKALVEMHNGTIELLSDLNKGSRFKISLPEKLDESINFEDAEYNESDNSMIEKVAVEFSDIYYY